MTKKPIGLYNAAAVPEAELGAFASAIAAEVNEPDEVRNAGRLHTGARAGETGRMIVHSAADFHGEGGIRLFRRSWLPSTTRPKAAVALVHGYAEHSGRYEWFGEQLAGAGIAVHAYDLRGHGRSDGPRATVRSFREHLDDLDAFLAIVRVEQPGPLFLFGHSMGGLIAALYTAVRRPTIDGLILSGPAVSNPDRATSLAASAIGLVAKVAPRMPTRRLPATAVSRDPEVVRAYDEDPLVHRGGIPAATLTAFPRAIRRLYDDASDIRVPLLIVHGSGDVLASPAGSQALFDRVGSTDRELKQYQGLAHEVLNEPERATVLSDIRAWIEARV
jgi:alpha-beta hydrolase superfamily lysophospholipase